MYFFFFRKQITRAVIFKHDFKNHLFHLRSGRPSEISFISFNDSNVPEFIIVSLGETDSVEIFECRHLVFCLCTHKTAALRDNSIPSVLKLENDVTYGEKYRIKFENA